MEPLNWKEGVVPVPVPMLVLVLERRTAHCTRDAFFGFGEIRTMYGVQSVLFFGFFLLCDFILFGY